MQEACSINIDSNGDGTTDEVRSIERGPSYQGETRTLINSSVTSGANEYPDFDVYIETDAAGKVASVIEGDDIDAIGFVAGHARFVHSFEFEIDGKMTEYQQDHYLGFFDWESGSSINQQDTLSYDVNQCMTMFVSKSTDGSRSPTWITHHHAYERNNLGFPTSRRIERVEEDSVLGSVPTVHDEEVSTFTYPDAFSAIELIDQANDGLAAEDSDGNTSDVKKVYTIDRLGRITRIDTDLGNDGSIESFTSFAYDDRHNRTRIEESQQNDSNTIEYTYGSDDEVLVENRNGTYIRNFDYNCN